MIISKNTISPIFSRLSCKSSFFPIKMRQLQPSRRSYPRANCRKWPGRRHGSSSRRCSARSMRRHRTVIAPAPSDAGPSRRSEASAVLPESFSLDASIFQKEECDIPKVDEADPEAVEKARRFARIIVSDIALYNQEAVIEGLKNGTFYRTAEDRC